MNKTAKQKTAPTGPKPERLKIEGDWESAIKISLQKKRPATGWPKLNGTNGKNGH